MTQEIRDKIIKRFMENVYGKTSETSRANQRHDGKKGHWLEKQMGVKPNADNKPDLWGYEMKNDTTSKTTFGDWSPNYWIFRDSQYDMTREDFLRIFGKANKHKGGRLSWSGEPVPKINGTNSFGVKTVIDYALETKASTCARSRGSHGKGDVPTSTGAGTARGEQDLARGPTAGRARCTSGRSCRARGCTRWR